MASFLRAFPHLRFLAPTPGKQAVPRRWNNICGNGWKSSDTVEVIGVEASKFVGVQRIFAQISPNLPEKSWWDFCLQIFSDKVHEDLFRFSANVGRHFCPDFQGF